MKKGIGLKVLAISIALVIVVSGVVPCIAVNNLPNNTLSKELLQSNDTIHAQHQMPLSSQPMNEYDFMKEGNTSISNKELVEGYLIPTKIAFYSDYASISDTSKTISGLSYYADALRAEGYTVEQIYGPITSSKLDEYGALLLIGLTEYLTESEKNAIYDFVANGGGLLVSGGSISVLNDFTAEPPPPPWGGIKFGKYVVCDPNDYEVHPKWVIIKNFENHPITQGVNKFIMYKGTNLSGITFTGQFPLAYSDDDSWLDEDGDWVCDPGEGKGPFEVTYTSPHYKVVLIPDSNVFDNSDADEDGIVAFNEYDNDVLGLNIVEWFVGEEEEKDVKINGTVTNIGYPISFPPIYTINIDEVIEDLLKKFHVGDAVSVSYPWDTPAEIDSGIEIGDNVEVYGAYYEGGYDITLNESEHYLKKTVHEPKVIYVDDDFIDDPQNHKWNTIQEGINDAEENDTIFVYSGKYYSGKGYGPITITKNGLKLIGEDRDTTIIDGCEEGAVITLTSSNCLITNFTICNSCRGNCCGIDLDNWVSDIGWIPTSHNEISHNIISNNCHGICTANLDNSTIRNNLIFGNRYGMIIWLSTNNSIIENNIVDNDQKGIYTHSMFCHNAYYHNNFINNEIQAVDEDFEINYWNSQEIMEGNYWSDYKEKYPDAEEIGDTGIWDTPYEVHGYYNYTDPKDDYPLVEPWSWEEEPQSFTFVHLTDPHIGYGIRGVPTPDYMVKSVEKFTDTLQDVKTHNPDFILNTGDIVEYDLLAFFKAYAEIIKSIKIPVYHTPGNHDSRGPGPEYGEFDLTNYYYCIENPTDTNPLNDGYHGYYFDKYGYRFIGLDSGRDYSRIDLKIKTPEGSGLTDSQNESLNEADMKDHPRKIIFMHHPVINDEDDGGLGQVKNNCSDYGGNDMCIAFHRCDFINYSLDNHVYLVLTGHTHKDLVRTIFNDAGTHETRFIQTRSATKDNPDRHGYRVIDIKDGVISNRSETTPSDPGFVDKSTFTLSSANWPEGPPTSCWGISVYDLDNRLTGVNETTGKIERGIPDSYYTGYYDKPPTETPQVLVVYPSKPLKVNFPEVTCPAGVSSMIQEPTTASEEIYLNFSIRDHTGTEIIEYRYDNVALTDYSTASVDLTSPEPDYTLEIDDNGDGVTDRTKEPEVAVILTVDDSGGAHYTRIQDAVNNASSGYTIEVLLGTYNEKVVINKSLKLIGEDKNTTIIDGGGSGTSVHVIADNVEISGFTIKNGSSGVYVGSSNGCIIDNNIITDHGDGICLYNSNNNTITYNSIFNTSLLISGIHLSSSNTNTIHDNDIFENVIGVSLYNSINNRIYHNNFIDNELEHACDNTGTNLWDKGPTEGGNYWSGHSCTGNPSDGSQPFIIDSDGVDYYPFQDKDGWLKESKPPIFDTGSPSNSYPSIFGTHNGTIKTNHTITVQKLYTYPCAGTGGHTEYARIWNNSGLDRFATWSGYKGDWHNITFNETFVLYKNKTYNYTIRTGSYPQIIHKPEHTTLEGSFINCTQFTDVNGKKYNNWILAIKLE